MALRNQPYIPLYVQDVQTDEKLAYCSAAAHGVYFLLLCILHKQEQYGVLLLKQRFKQKGNIHSAFAFMLSKQMPFDVPVIESALKELSGENVITLTDGELRQKRMVKDGELSKIRSRAGKKGAASKKNKAAFVNSFAKAKAQATYENESEGENEGENEEGGGLEGEVIFGSEEENAEVEEILNHYTYITGAQLNVNYYSAGKAVLSLLHVGFVKSDFFKVIEHKMMMSTKKRKGGGYEWSPAWLSPDTLFNPSKFENYVNEAKRAEASALSGETYGSSKLEDLRSFAGRLPKV